MSKDILKDGRFTKLLNDPKFREIPKTERKVKIDKRFQSMFNDDKFKVKYTVDKRGRPVNQSSTENLQRFYDLSSDESSDESDGDVESSSSLEPDLVKSHKEQDGIELGTNEIEKSDEADLPTNNSLKRGNLPNEVKKRLKNLDIDYARGEGVLFTDSSSDEDSVIDESIDSELEHEWGELDADAETTEESTRRFAVCNMDWDNIKAIDIMVLFNSFLPPGGVINKVSIYPSEYGLKRMKEEEINGPVELTAKKDDKSVDEEENEEGSYYHMEKLRKYQLNRLKYYYAVIECNTVATADKLYSECDGLEYEKSATKLDLRYIADDITFDQEPREVCTEIPDLNKYRPRLFKTSALQQAKVELTWDMTDPDRMDAIKNALEGNTDDPNLKEYLASSSSDEESKHESEVDTDEEKDPIQKYRSLLQDIQTKEEEKKSKDVEMEISWGMGLKQKSEELMKKKLKNDAALTPFEKFVEKRKEKRMQKRIDRKNNINRNASADEYSSDDVPSDVDLNDPYFAEEEFAKKPSSNRKKKDICNDKSEQETKNSEELELLLDDDDGRKHFSLKKIQEAENNTKSKRKRKFKSKNIPAQGGMQDFEINPNDTRFSAIYTSHLYNIDPTDSNFKKTKGMETLIHEKLKRRPKEMPAGEVEPPKKLKNDASMNVLIKSIKRKTGNINKQKR